MMALGNTAIGLLALTQMVIGHRGLGANHSPQPENSMVAMVEAIKDGAMAVELDVQLTSDGKIVLAHDHSLERMSTGQGCVDSKTYDELAALRLRDGTGKPTDERFSLLADTLNAIRGFDDLKHPFLVDIHIKVYDGMKGDWAGVVDHCPKTKHEELARKVLSTVRELGMLDRVLFTCFDSRVLDLLRKLAPEAKVGLLSDYRTSHALSKAMGRYDAVAFHYRHFSREEVQRAHEHGLALYAWSPAKQATMEKLFAEYHIDGVITDNLPNALRACKKSCYK